MKTAFGVFIGLILSLSAAVADIQLVAPAKAGGMPVVQAISERKTRRAFSDRDFPPETLSTLLWIANGISRPDGRRTIPTGHNVQDLDVYVILKSGAYRYDEKAHALVMTSEGDFRKLAGKQPFSHAAPVTLFFVQDLARAKKTDGMSHNCHPEVHADSQDVVAAGIRALTGRTFRLPPPVHTGIRFSAI